MAGRLRARRSGGRRNKPEFFGYVGLLLHGRAAPSMAADAIAPVRLASRNALLAIA